MSDYERIGYRELGLRLGITTDAARMKAKRMEKARRWRLIPGNHPSDPVTIEIPVGTVPPLKPDAAPVQQPPKTESDMAKFAASLVIRVEALTDQLLVEKDAHAKTLSELTAAEAREIGTAQELAGARKEIDELKRRMKRRGLVPWR